VFEIGFIVEIGNVAHFFVGIMDTVLTVLLKRSVRLLCSTVRSLSLVVSKRLLIATGHMFPPRRE
jgi:hypothetical protein